MSAEKILKVFNKLIESEEAKKQIAKTIIEVAIANKVVELEEEHGEKFKVVRKKKDEVEK